MKTAELKADLYQLIDQTNDISVLKAVKILLSKRVSKMTRKDFWDELPEFLKAEIEEAAVQSENGEVYAHADLVEELKSKYNIELRTCFGPETR